MTNTGYTGRLTRNLALVRDARLRAENDSDGGTETDLFLRTRRLLEHELNAGPAGISDEDFRQAAVTLADTGHGPEAEILTGITATGRVLEETSREWAGRYRCRPPTVAEENDARLLNEGRARLAERASWVGCDGSGYVAANLEPLRGRPARPAVVITTDAGTDEIITGFHRGCDRSTWLADRGVGTGQAPGGPLRSALDGPWCRAAREELVLAHLIRGGALGAGTGGLWARAFSSYLRSECLRAWQAVQSSQEPPGPGTPELTRQELRHLLLRAPGWTADRVGWPFGDRALEYFDRLAATPVPEAEANAAARELLHEDAIAVRLARPRTPARRAEWRLAPPLPDPAPGPAPHM